MTQAARFEDYATNEDELVAEAAMTLESVKDAYERGDLSKGEFDELVDDVLEFGQIDALGDSLERKIVMKQAFEALKMIAKTVM